MQEFIRNVIKRGVENIAQIPAQLGGFFKRRRFGFLKKRGIAELLEQVTNLIDIALLYRGSQIRDDGQHRAGVKLGRMCSENNPCAKIIQQGFQFFFQPLERDSLSKLAQTVALLGLMNFCISGIFERIDQYHLPFDILNDLKQELNLLIFIKVSAMGLEEIPDNLLGRLPELQALIAGLLQKR